MRKVLPTTHAHTHTQSNFICCEFFGAEFLYFVPSIDKKSKKKKLFLNWVKCKFKWISKFFFQFEKWIKSAVEAFVWTNVHTHAHTVFFSFIGCHLSNRIRDTQNSKKLKQFFLSIFGHTRKQNNVSINKKFASFQSYKSKSGSNLYDCTECGRP